MRKVALMGPFLGLLLVIASVGCGGSGGSGTAANPFAGSYDGTSDIDGQAGSLAIDVAQDGTASGTLVVASSPSRALVGIPPGSYTFAGTTTNDGTMTASGQVSGTQNFDVSGSFPLTTAHSTFTLASGGHNYNVDVQVHSSGGSANLTFSQDSSNGHLGSWSSSAETTFQVDGSDYRLNTFDPIQGFSRSFSANVPNTVHAGDVITLTPSILSTITYNEIPTGEILPNVWRGSSGTMTVLSVSSTHLRLQLTDVRMDAVTTIGAASGSFVLNGTIEK